MIIDNLKADVVAAMKAKDEVRLTTLRSLLSAINYLKIDAFSQQSLGEVGQKDLTDEDVQSVIAKEIKKRREAIEMYTMGKRQDLIDKETAEMNILLAYAPKQLSPEEIEKIVSGEIEKLKAGGQAVNQGVVMKAVMMQLKGKVDGMTVKEVVERLLR